MKSEVGYLEMHELAKNLNVSEPAIRDVQLPGHFDLSFKEDVWGMNFMMSYLDLRGDWL